MSDRNAEGMLNEELGDYLYDLYAKKNYVLHAIPRPGDYPRSNKTGPLVIDNKIVSIHQLKELCDKRGVDPKFYEQPRQPADETPPF
jgi:hypothetical protein